jgi:hypothetical protein
VYEVIKLTVKTFFVADILFLGVILHLDKHIFPLQTCLIGGSPSIRAVLHSGKYGNINVHTENIFCKKGFSMQVLVSVFSGHSG